ncbi:ATPase, T2SS/T4P/T4SS family [Janthinobacterium sp. FW305-128]|uniref:ATPase, T2SS/T4P/T4SS family n=1 Tax=Janthinobacterium sp. FW305-128 TaxID=2775055 RepID=UPI001E428215|nr:ATPase, T2SS/T4P/T4SS family [Janthinobacterium sp. FW305-128]MCC7684712.1 Flp pilus assembly complex ATPase component TadA [Janthinobacterium sp. FW305-128]
MLEALKNTAAKLMGRGKKNDGFEADVSVSAKRIMPTNLEIYSTPKDLESLPNYVSIISAKKNNGKKGSVASLNLDGNLENFICALKHNANHCTIVASVNLFHSSERTAILSSVRSELELFGFNKTQVIWASVELVTDLVRSKKSSTAPPAENNSVAFEKVHNSANKDQFIKFITTAVRCRASDIHIEIKKSVALVRHTIDGKLYPTPDYKNGEVIRDIAYDAVAHAFTFHLDTGSNSSSHFDDSNNHSCTITLTIDEKEYTLRATSNPTNQGNDFIARIAPANQYSDFGTLDDSGYSKDQLFMLRGEIPKEGGMVLFAGKPNSGKTTSLIKCLLEIPNRSEKKFVAVEDPIEYDLYFQSSGSIQAGIDDQDKREKAYTETVAQWLRGNPHVFNSGEIRDAPSGDAAVATAQLGLCTFGTLHVGSVMGIMPRLATSPIKIDMGTLTLPGLLKCLTYQSLVPTLCTKCRVPFAESTDSKKKNKMLDLAVRFGVDVSKTHFYGDDKKCPACDGHGHHGQTLVAEMYVPDDEFLEAMRKGLVFEAKRIWLSKSDGRWDSDQMQGKPVFAHALKKTLDGLIDIEEILRFGNPETIDPGMIRQHIERPKLAKFRGGEIVASPADKLTGAAA